VSIHLAVSTFSILCVNHLHCYQFDVTVRLAQYSLQFGNTGTYAVQKPN